ncbi:hypothetical protein DFH27DRAFT_649370 [Peziza echinospora]|nr:hypothetical protein DFH27DRAFT_649370 [Peziza echinospora]
MIELHIWGPGFGLPSMDPECLAAVAYMQSLDRTMVHDQQDAYGEKLQKQKWWCIVPSSNPLLSPSHTLPCIHDTRHHFWVGGGYTGMVEYLAQVSRGAWDLDGVLRGEEGHPRPSAGPPPRKQKKQKKQKNKQRRASTSSASSSSSGSSSSSEEEEAEEEDTTTNTNATPLPSYTLSTSTAYTSYIRSNFSTLVDLSLYVSWANYEGVTRPEYSRGLEEGGVGLLWPTQYWVPGERRREKVARCERVLREWGVSEGEVDPPTTTTVLGGQDAGGAEERTGSGVGVGSILKNKFGKGAGGMAGGAAARVKLKSGVTGILTPIAARIVPPTASGTMGNNDGAEQEEETLQFFFNHDSPTSLDCLILGYLLLCIQPVLPNPFLAETIAGLDGGRGGRGVVMWTKRFRERVFGAGGGAGGVGKGSRLPWAKEEDGVRVRGRADLPWLARYTASQAAGWVGGYLPRNPFVGGVKGGKGESSSTLDTETDAEKERRRKREVAERRERVVRVATVVGGVIAFVGFLVGTGIVGGDGGEVEYEIVDEGEAVLEEVERDDQVEGGEEEEEELDLKEFSTADFLGV